MKRITLIAFSIYLFLFIQGCNQSVSNQKANVSSIENEETNINSKDTIVTEFEVHCKYLQDTIINIDDKQIDIKMEIVDIPGEFIIQEAYGGGKVYITKIPDTEINIQISDRHYKLQKQEIPYLNPDFLNISTFYRIDFHSFSEQAITFEIGLGEPETCNLVYVFLTIDLEGNKTFNIKFPEWDEDE